jgi:ornithine cyclodeaminase
MTRIIQLNEIKRLLSKTDITQLLSVTEEGFMAYSAGMVVVPPVGHLGFQQPPGDVHIKYGYIKDDEYYVVKVASSFYGNPRQGLPSSNGTMLIFSQKTGELKAILLDEGYLTDVRTALAGALVANYLAPQHVECIGVIGTGVQARFQVEYLKDIINCQKLCVYGRSPENLEQYAADMRKLGYGVVTTMNPAEVAENSNFIITTTPSANPVLHASDIRPGTHITAMGADAKGKQELDPAILQKADIVAVDSLSQCSKYGEVSYALQQGLINDSKPIEIGNLKSSGVRRINDSRKITVADLTGVAVQDIEIAKLVYLAAAKA